MDSYIYGNVGSRNKWRTEVLVVVLSEVPSGQGVEMFFFGMFLLVALGIYSITMVITMVRVLQNHFCDMKFPKESQIYQGQEQEFGSKLKSINMD